MSRPMKEQTLELIVLALVVIATSGLVFFLVGESLTFLATGHASGAHIYIAIGLALRVIANLSSPALAWPPETPAVFNPAVFWIFAIVLFAIVLAVIRRLGFSWGRALGRYQRPESARWAKTTDLSRLAVDKPEQGRIVVGKVGRQTVACERAVSAIVLGPPGSLKTTSLIVPTIVQWQGPAIVTSVKTDVLDDTIAARRKMGNTLIFDPAAAVGSHRRNTWSPLARCHTWGDAMKTANALVSSAKQATGGSSENEIWYQSAQQLLAPMLFAAALGGHDIGTVLDWLDASDIDEAKREIMENVRGEESLRPLRSLQGTLETPDQKSSIFFTARNTIEAYRTPSVLDSARTSEIHPEALFDGGMGTLYICAPPHDQKALRAPFATLILSFINYAYEEHVRTGKVLDPPLLLAFDELANIAPIEDLDEIASTARGVGIQLVSVFQDVGQIRQRWGEARAQTILNNHIAKIILPGIADEHTHTWLSKVTGEQEIRQVSYTDGHSNKSSTDSTTFRALLPANLVREQKTGTGLLIYGNLPPVKLDLKPWFEDKPLRQIIEDAKRNDPQRVDPTKPLSEVGANKEDEGKPVLVAQSGRPKRLKIQGFRKLADREELAGAVLRVAAETTPFDAYAALNDVGEVTHEQAYRVLGTGGTKSKERNLALYSLDMHREVLPAVYARTDSLWPQLAPAGLDTPSPTSSTNEPPEAPKGQEPAGRAGTDKSIKLDSGFIIDPETGEVLSKRAPAPGYTPEPVPEPEPLVAVGGGEQGELFDLQDAPPAPSSVSSDDQRAGADEPPAEPIWEDN